MSMRTECKHFESRTYLSGDTVRIDIKNRTLDLLVDPAELEARKVGWKPLTHKYTQGVLAKYSKLVQSASKGAICQ